MGDVVKLLRLGVVGAAGMLGRELLAALAHRKLHVMELLPIGSDGSGGEGVEFQGEDLALRPPTTELAGLDAVFLCAPAEASLGYVRRALHARVPCLDLSGALATSAEVPLLDAQGEGAGEPLAAPLVSVAGGSALALSRVLRALDAEAPLTRVQATVLESTAAAGHRAMAALSTETIALLNQQEAEDPETLPWPIAFDCHAVTDEADLAGRSGREVALAASVERLLGRALPLDCTVLRIPTFAGEGAVLAVETARPLDPSQAAARLAKTPGLEVVSQDPGGLRTRASTGSESVRVGRIRQAAGGTGLLLWLAADGQRITALNAVDLAARLLAAGPSVPSMLQGKQGKPGKPGQPE